MKFLVDMPLSPKTVHFLKNLGYEAIRVSELGMAKSKDRDIFDYSVIIFRLKDPSPEHVNSLLSSNLSSIEKELRKGVIVIIEDTEIRIRELPIGNN